MVAKRSRKTGKGSENRPWESYQPLMWRLSKGGRYAVDHRSNPGYVRIEDTETGRIIRKKIIEKLQTKFGANVAWRGQPRMQVSWERDAIILWRGKRIKISDLLLKKRLSIATRIRRAKGRRKPQ